MVEFFGGPLDGTVREVEDNPLLVIIPELVRREAIYLAEDEPSPAWVDEAGRAHFGKKPEFVDHHYRRGTDGNYYYQSKEA